MGEKKGMRKDQNYIADFVSSKVLKQINAVYYSVGSDIFHRQRKVSERKAELEKRALCGKQ